MNPVAKMSEGGTRYIQIQQKVSMDVRSDLRSDLNISQSEISGQTRLSNKLQSNQSMKQPMNETNSKIKCHPLVKCVAFSITLIIAVVTLTLLLLHKSSNSPMPGPDDNSIRRKQLQNGLQV